MKRIHVYRLKANILRKLVSDYPIFGNYMIMRANLRRSHFIAAFDKLV